VVYASFEKNPTAELDYMVDWEDWLGDDTIATSTWDVPSGLNQEAESNDDLTATIWLSGGTAGEVYSVVNEIFTTGNRTDSRIVRFLITPNPEALGAWAYLTTDDAEERLWANYNIQADVRPGDVASASTELDRYEGPFIGAMRDLTGGQVLAVPRDITPEGYATATDDVPDEVLDWVALRAYELSREDEPPVTSRGLIGASVTYGRAAVPRTTRLMVGLLDAYQLKSGTRL
jgi:hypothetical protein